MFQKGHKISEETKRKISLSNLGKKKPEEQRRKISKAMMGNRCGAGNKGRKNTEDVKRKISESAKRSWVGRWMKGKHLSEETKRKISEYQKKNPTKYWLGKFKELHPNWRGGISFEPYSMDWTQTLKRSIRERDKYVCQFCGKEPAIQIHHIDYKKTNCDPDNLITLCHSCHSKTNYNRSHWIKVFNRLRP